MSNRISIVRGTTKDLAVQLVDTNGDPIPMSKLAGASAEFLVRVHPTDLTNVLRYSTKDTPTSLLFDPLDAVLDVNIAPGDTAGLSVQVYFYQLTVTLIDGEFFDVIPWDVFDVNLGGAAQTPPPPFPNTVLVNQDWQLPGNLSYFTPGGSPIGGAQVRVYFKSDYDAGNLASPVGITTTNAFGGWTNPILVLPGYNYVIRFEQPNSFGPDTATIFA